MGASGFAYFCPRAKVGRRKGEKRQWRHHQTGYSHNLKAQAQLTPAAQAVPVVRQTRRAQVRHLRPRAAGRARPPRHRRRPGRHDRRPRPDPLPRPRRAADLKSHGAAAQPIAGFASAYTCLRRLSGRRLALFCGAFFAGKPAPTGIAQVLRAVQFRWKPTKPGRVFARLSRVKKYQPKAIRDCPAP